MSIMSANEDGPSSSTVDASTEVKPSTEKEPTSSDKSKIGQESSSSIAPPGSNEQQPESSSTKEEDDPKNRLIAFYQKHNPEKLNTVDSTLEKYEGKEDELFRKLEAKYMPTPVSKYQVPGGKGPTCFLEFTIDGEPAGKVTVKLFSDKVPLASDNFQALCTGSKGNGRKGKPLCYKNSKIHRVVPLFCVQMGDFTLGDGTGGESIYEPNTSGVSDSMGRFRDEEFFQHSKKGLLSMANNGADRNGSQFFFTLRPCHSLDGKHVVFGEVISGMDVVEKIGQLQTTPKQRPQQSVEITNCGEIVDGKDIPCQVTAEKAPAPFSFGAATFGSTTSGQTNSSGFGGLAASAKASSTFGFGAANSSTGSSPFSFGAVASSLQSGGGFGSSPGGTSKLSGGVASAAMPSSNPSPPGFGATGSAATSKPFGSGGTGKLPDGASVFAKPSNNPSPFSFGATGSTTSKPFGGGGPMTAFGSSSSSNPFTFGSLASQGGDLPFGGAKPTDSGPTLAFPGEPSSAPGMSYRGGEGGGGVAAEVSDSEDDDSEDDEYHKIINAR
jgi:cyclophilin family peptidyl-prolyl cis-trans isomerase